MRIGIVLLASVLSFALTSQRMTADESEDNAEARKAADRFLMVLERNPRRGTALDKVVEFHLDHESLDELLIQLREKAESTEDEDAGRAWLVVGLIEASQGDAESAQSALERADELLPKSAVASYSLGQNLMTLNRWPEAAEALERAIQRKPAPTDLLDIFQTLGRVQQRLTSGDKVVEVWTRLEKLVPNDPRVPELVAKTLLDDGHWEAALPRFEALAKATKDLYRRSEFELEAVDLRLKLGQFEAALAEADRLLGGLKPDHWLFRETRRRVEEAFLAKDDSVGLIKHYEERLTKQPDDLDAVVRLVRAFVSQDRRKDARSRLEASIKLAPSSVELRLELIELLQSDQQFAEAIAQYEQLDRIAPNNPDYIRDWGFAVLKFVVPPSGGQTADAEDRLKAERRAKSAAAIWRKLVEAKPKDAVVAAQVADLMASADKSQLGDAAELLRRAIELEPEILSHREQLGEVLDAAGQKEESLAAWRAIAEGPRRNANNLAQLAEVLSRFGYRDESLKTIDEACELDRKSLELRFQQAELRRKWKQAESAMAALAEAAALADTPETFDRVVQLEVKVLTESELLTERIEALQAELTALGAGLPTPPKRSTAGLPERDLVANKEETFGPDQRRGRETRAERTFDSVSPAPQQFRLAKYLEAADSLREATVAARKAVELAPRNGVFLQAAAKMLMQDSQWLSAVELYERLLKLDRRFRIDSLRSIAELEQKLGRKDKALKASRDLLAGAPGNPEVAEFVVDVHLRFNQNAEALQILRRSSRQNPADKRLALKLVERLMEDGAALLKANGGRQPSGSASDKTTEGASRTPGGLRPPFASSADEAREVLWRVFEQTAKTDDRIEIVRKLAELSVFPGEFAKLTQRLERYRAEPKLRRDASLALVQVQEQSGDTEQARRELERVLPQAPRDVELLKRMVSLCETSGDLDGAITHQKRIAEVTRKRDADEHLIVLLRRAGRDAEADLLATRWLESERDPVKVLREIDRLIADAAASKNQSVHQAHKLIHVWLDREPQNWEFLFRQAQTLFALNRIPESWGAYDELMGLPIPDDTPSLLAPSRTTGTTLSERTAQRVQQIRSRTNIESHGLADFGGARIAALLHRMAHKVEPTIPTPVGLDAKATAVRVAWDEVYLNLVRGAGRERLRLRLELLTLAPDDSAAQWLALTSLYSLRTESGFRPLAPWRETDKSDPLDADTLDRLLAAFRSLQSCDEAMEWDRTPVVEILCRELIRAGRIETVNELLAELERTTESPEALGWLLQQAAINDDVESALRILTKLTSLDVSRAKLASTTKGTRHSDPANVAWWLSRLMIRDRQKVSDRLELSADNLRILDAAFAAFSQPNVGRSSPKARIAIPDTLPPSGGFEKQLRVVQKLVPYDLGLVWQTTTLTGYLEESFPSVDAMPELSVIHVLRQAWSQAATTRERIELFRHVKASADRATMDSRQRFLWEVALTSLRWWDHWTPDGKLREPSLQRDSLPMMRELFEFAEASSTLKLGIVSCHLKYEEREVALDLLDRITTTDGAQLKSIEQLAIQIAGKLGRMERVKLAAERLFGMKLEPAEEQQLAATLSGLGLHEHAEAIRQRLPQRAGNNLAVLQQAMQERIDAKKIDEACQIAEQIIRRTSPANTLIGSVQQSTFGGGQQARVITTTSTARTKALALLGQQGRLGPLIEQAEQQFDRSPQSLKLFGQLAELYGAEQPPKGGTTNSTNDKIAKLLVRLADSDAPDPQFRLTLARALVSAGKAELAVPHFLFAIEKLPNATAQVLFEAEQILSELGHVDELAAIVLKSKLAVNDQQRIELFRRIVQRLHGPPIRANLIIDLFEKAFREAPEFRPMLAAQLLALSGSIWQQEELFPLARDLAVPPESLTNVGPWYGIDIVNKQPASPANLLTRNVVELAKQIGKLDELEAHTYAAMKTHPDWTVGGNVTLGLIKLRREGQIAQAKPLFEVMFRGRKDYDKVFGTNSEHMSNFHLLACGVGHELAVAGEFAAASEFYELTTPELALDECRLFGREPVMQQLAVRIVNRMLAKLDNPDELARQAGSPLFVEAAKITAEIKQPYVAARLAQAMITRWQLPGANNSDGGTWLEQLEQRFANSLAAIKPEMLLGILEQTVVRTPTSEQTAEKKSNRPDVGVRSTPAIDLLSHVTGDSLATLRLDSPFVSLIREAAKDKDLWAKWSAELRQAEGQGDLSLAILTALTELNAPAPNTATPTSLVEVARGTLKTERSRTAPPGFHPQLGLWLVARECLAHDEHQKVGRELAELATESAAQHFDPRFQWAILRERGELALKAGDKELARTLWARLADDVLKPRSTEEVVPMLLGKRFVWSANWSSTRLDRARELCRLTLNGEMLDLSLAIFRNAVSEAEIIGSSEDILATWDTLEPEWRGKGVAADAIFAALMECVLPTSRPGEVFVFTVCESVVRTPTSERFANGKENRPDVGVRSTSPQPQSLALRLVQLAVAEKRIDVLTQRLAEREKSATNSLASRLIHLLLARQTNDEQRLDAELTKLAQHDWSKPTTQDARIATQIVGLLVPLTERRKPIEKLFEQWLVPLGKAFPRDEHPLADVRRWLAKQQLTDGQSDKAKETVSAHLRHMDQVWSATGAMDGQHLRRLELLAIATDYANAGLTREAIDLLAQVADARWPDRYFDENPGAVLAILEAKLKSRPAQERYELWRTWSLPNDGVKSMRMLTGAGDRELRSSAYLLVDAAREADRLAELDAFVEEQMKQRPSDRIHVLLALIHFANKAPAVAEPLVRQQITLWEPQAGKSNSATRTRVWDDWLLSVGCSRNESLRELAKQLATRAESGARELKDEVLLNLLRR